MSDLNSILALPKTIAIVGLSDNEARPSFQVANYLQQQGFKIIPVNPSLTQVLGEKAYPNLAAIPKEISIDIVDVFRQPDTVLELVNEILDLKIKPILWLQEGVIAPAAKELAVSAGMTVYMNLCIKKLHQSLEMSARV